MIVKMEATRDRQLPSNQEQSENTEKKIIYANLESSNDTSVQIKSEQELQQGDTSSLLRHNQLYTRLLEAYVKDFENNSVSKLENKRKLFIIAMILLCVIPMTSLVIIGATLLCLANKWITALESISELITAMVAFISTFMVIPKMITKYLFNKKEEEHLANIIGKIQAYDKDIRGGLE